MHRKPLRIVGVLVGVIVLALGSQAAGAQGNDKGRIVRSHREGQGGGRPDWVTAGLQRSMAHLQAHGAAHGLRNAAAELALRSADEDDLGLTHLRLDQVHGGVPVFGGQLVTHLDAVDVREVGGRTFETGNAATTPRISGAQAIRAATDALGYHGALANRPEAKLVVLPNRDETPGATLTYQVELLVEDGTDRTGRYEYFVDAETGSVVWFYNNSDTVAANGTGDSLYSGTVSIGTDRTSGTHYLRDLNRGRMLTYTMRNGTTSGYYLTDSDNWWGNNTNGDEDTAGVDAHFGAAKTWDYYLNTHGRRGIDGNGYRMDSRVHYGARYNNAFWNGSVMTYGDGDGVEMRPLVSLDVVGHEITHGLTDKTADLVYANESGALNESFSDIFGTAVEFFANGVNGIGGRKADYLIAEDIYIPNDAAPGFRNMQDPAEDNDPDHYSKRLYQAPCTASNTNDNCGVHSNSGIQNHAFYLLAEGGVNRTSGLSVTRIGRPAAEKIFYRALTLYLGPSSNFSNARAASLRAAAELYGTGSTQYNATAQAWTAVGVQ